MQRADFILLMTDEDKIDINYFKDFLDKLIVVRNKIDLTKHKAHIEKEKIFISIKTGAGLELLKNYLKTNVGFNAEATGNFIARRRHLEALKKAEQFLLDGQKQIHALELLAEDLRQAQNSLGEITGKFYPDDLLDRIFSGFCIGK